MVSDPQVLLRIADLRLQATNAARAADAAASKGRNADATLFRDRAVALDAEIRRLLAES